jgi:hypothetical protein
MVTKEKGWKAEFIDGILSATNEKGTNWTVKFLFVTSAPEEEVKKRPYSIHNMAVIGREQLRSLGVNWSKNQRLPWYK